MHPRKKHGKRLPCFFLGFCHRGTPIDFPCSGVMSHIAKRGSTRISPSVSCRWLSSIAGFIIGVLPLSRYRRSALFASYIESHTVLPYIWFCNPIEYCAFFSFFCWLFPFPVLQCLRSGVFSLFAKRKKILKIVPQRFGRRPLRDSCNGKYGDVSWKNSA